MQYRGGSKVLLNDIGEECEEDAFNGALLVKPSPKMQELGSVDVLTTTENTDNTPMVDVNVVKKVLEMMRRK